jgi:pimeloyl-ACP methyl ester carboxylesterase
MKTVFFLAAVAVLGLPSGRAEEFDSDGVKIHYEVKGRGEPVILIHGLYASAKLNWDLPGITAELAKQYCVIALDNRGHGQSGKPTADNEYGGKMAGDIVRLMDHLHLTNARVAGYSLGGMIAMKLMVQHPERVKSAVLGGMGWLRTGSPEQHFFELAPERENVLTPPACVRGMAKLAVTEAEVKAIRVPVTIIVGEHDPCRRMYVEPLQKIRSDWPVRVIAGAGHLSCVGKADLKEQLKVTLAAGAPPKP